MLSIDNGCGIILSIRFTSQRTKYLEIHKATVIILHVHLTTMNMMAIWHPIRNSQAKGVV